MVGQIDHFFYLEHKIMFEVGQDLKKGQFLIFVYFFGGRGVRPFITKILSPPPPRKKIRKKVETKLNKEL